jgi:hypothetical protein
MMEEAAAGSAQRTQAIAGVLQGLDRGSADTAAAVRADQALAALAQAVSGQDEAQEQARRAEAEASRLRERVEQLQAKGGQTTTPPPPPR